MIKYVIKRLLIMIPILLAVAILIFTLMACVPGDPARLALGDSPTITEEMLQSVRIQMGLDKPFLVRLGTYLKDVFLRFDFGTSYQNGIAVRTELASRFPKTLLLASMCIVLMLVLGIPAGIRAAVKANSVEDRLSMFITLIGNSMPNFWLALLLVLLFSLHLNWLPSSGAKSFKYFILPALSGGLGGVASIARQTRASMLEVIRSDYVTTARSKGLSPTSVIFSHALPNALIPVITVTAQQFSFMLGGIAVIEAIFSIPGIGSFLITSISARDYPCVQACVIYIAFTFSIMMLLTDLIYAFVDPRIKSQYAGRKRKQVKSK